MSLSEETKKALRRAGRERTVEAMKEGRRLRPTVIESAKRYQRRGKYPEWRQ